MRLGILTSHPIQYQAPWFRALAKETDLHVFFAHRQSAVEQGKAGFGVAFDWDVDLLSGYSHTFLRNVARKPGVNHFFGCGTPEIREIIRGSLITNNRQPITDNARSVFDAFIVSGWNLKSYWQAIRACRKAGIPVLVRGDSQLGATRSHLKRAIKQFTHRVALRQFDGFLSVGQRNREYLLHYGVPAEKIFFVPHFVDNDRFAFQAKELEDRRLEIRGQWGIAEDAFCVLFCGKFIPKKRPLDLIEAAQLLLRSHPELKTHLLFVGSGELGAELRANCSVVFAAEAARKRDNRDQITLRGVGFHEPEADNQKPRASFTGFLNQTEISRAYVAADCLILPSDYRETWGLAVNEAMACGLPAIVSDAVGCAPDLIEEGRTGFVFPLGDVAALARSLVKFVELRRQRHDFVPALAGKLRAYSLETAVSGTLGAAEELSVRANG